MKKLATLLLAAGLVFGAATGAQAIDFKAKGQWIMSFDLGHGGAFWTRNRNDAGRVAIPGWGRGGLDNFDARQRVRLALEAVASEFLSGTVQFEIGDQRWGQGEVTGVRGTGGALGADGLVVEVKHAYIDWLVPNTDLKVRMGIQPVSLPSFATGGSMIFADDVAGITLSYKFNDTASLAFVWARPYNDNFAGDAVAGRRAPAGLADNTDMFALLLPLSFDGVKVTPWAMLGFIGPNTLRVADDFWVNAPGVGGSVNAVRSGMFPAVWARSVNDNNRLNHYGTAFWFGLTGEVTAWDPFRLAWDFNIGTADYGKRYLSRGGWYLALLAEYKLDWGTPGIYGWYSSGDDSNTKNGSERMPTIRANGDNDFSWFAGNGNPYLGTREGLVGNTMVGTWGIGARLKDMSFVEGLKHTLRVNYFQGTNSPGMARYIRGADVVNRIAIQNPMMNADFRGQDQLYLTERDSALELGLTTTYKIYDNLTLMVDMGYIALWLDRSSRVWGDSRGRGWDDASRNFSGTDAWNVNASFVYQF